MRTGRERRLGHGLRRYLLANLIDNVGTGLWAPLSLIFFTRAQHLPIDDVGAALSAGGLLGLLAGPLAGNLVDRWGPARFVVLGNLARAGICALYPAVGSAWQVCVLAAVFTGCERLFWTANAPLLGALVPEPDLTWAFGLLSTSRLVGLGAGAGLGAAFGGGLVGDAGGLHLIAYGNAVSYVGAAVLASAAGSGRYRADRSGPGPGTADGGWRSLLADRPYLLLCLLQVQLTLATQSLVVILPVVALDVLRGPAWLPGALVVLACCCLVLARGPALRLVERRSRTYALRLSCLLFTVAFLAMVPAGVVPAGWAVPLALAVAAVGGTAEALYAPVTMAMANEVAPAALKGRYSALFQTAFGLAGAAGPVLFTTLLAVGNGTLWAVMAGLSLVSTLVVPPVLRTLRRPPTPCSSPAAPPSGGPGRSADPVPRRIVLAGVPGAGKTTLAARLSLRLGVPHIELDGLYHGPDWSTRDEFADDVRAVTAAPGWVCDAPYYWVVGDILGSRADTFVWLDLPRRTVLRRVVRRSVVRVVTGRRLWHGNVETWRSLLFNPQHPVRLVWARYGQRQRETAEFLARYPHARTVRLTSPAEVRRWLGTLPDRLTADAPREPRTPGTPRESTQPTRSTEPTKKEGAMFNTDTRFMRVESPYEVHLAQNTLTREQVARLYETAPMDRTAAISRTDPRHEKLYQMNLVYLMVNNQESRIIESLPEEWQELYADLSGGRVTRWLSEGTGIKLDGLSLDIGVYTHHDGDFLSAHKDKPDKAITALLYLNEEWPAHSGGEFEIRVSGDHATPPVFSIAPQPGLVLAFPPNDKSWHSVSRIATGGSPTRLLIQFEYWYEHKDRYPLYH
ncbi:MFS transporter [Streptomyces sp. NPDC002225]|uniref:MFS transporter n=1 Tax=Streptomyces sp. NPDC002225 TaxID=3154413 RepID=UPI00331F2532